MQIKISKKALRVEYFEFVSGEYVVSNEEEVIIEE